MARQWYSRRSQRWVSDKQTQLRTARRRSIVQRFTDRRVGHGIDAIEVRDRSLQRAGSMVPARAKGEAACRLLEHSPRVGTHAAVREQPSTWHFCIHAHTEPFISVPLAFAGGAYSLADCGGKLFRVGNAKSRKRNRTDMHMHVDPVRQRARQPRAIPLDVGRGALTTRGGIA